VNLRFIQRSIELQEWLSQIETYTWDVLPPEMKLDVSTSIQREYEWVLSQFDGVALNSASGSPLR
jgi:hypothetical protein